MFVENTYTIRELLADIGSIASIIGLILTFIIFLGLRSIKNSYIFRIRSPQFIRFLNSKVSEFDDLAREFSTNSKQIADEFVKVDVRLRYMQERTSGSAKEAVIDLRKNIKLYELSPDDKEKFNLAYREMLRVIEEVKELQQDLNLE